MNKIVALLRGKYGFVEFDKESEAEDAKDSL